MDTSAKDIQYFNLHTTGLGYLNDIREVKPKKGDAFLACRIAALTGDSQNVEYRYFDCNVVGAEACKLINRCKEAVSQNKKVLISFVIGDLWADQYTANKDTKFYKKGDTVVSLKGRLLRIKSVKVDGEVKYREKTSTQPESEQ